LCLLHQPDSFEGTRRWLEGDVNTFGEAERCLKASIKSTDCK
jgi:hypothetical protein